MRSDPHSSTAIIWLTLVAALMPLRLRDVRRLLAGIVRRIRAYDPNVHVFAPLQLDAFRRKFAACWKRAV